MKNKILIDLERLRYPHSGLANVFRNIAKGIEIEIEDNNLDIQYFGPQAELSHFLNNDKIIPYQKWHRYIECFSKKYNLVHISHQGALHFRKNYKNTIKVLTLHDLNFLHEDLSERKKQKLYKRVNKSLENVDCLVCISHFVKEDFIKNRHLFTLKKLKDIVVIHNGIELPQKKNYELGKFEHLKSKKFILNIGVLFAKKNQKALVEMLPYIEEDLVLVASGEKEPYASEVREKIKNLGLEHRVHFLKNISEEEKYALIQHCEAMCHPSLAEGFGIPPIEAMALGKPVFLSNYTSLPEIGGNLAFYFNDFQPKEMANFYSEKMSFFRENRSLLEKQLRDWASKFSHHTMARNYLHLYHRLLNIKD